MPALDFFRVNIIDDRSTLSLLAPPHGPKMLTAVVGLDFSSSRDLLEAAAGMDESWIRSIQAQLAMFDEFNVDELDSAWSEIIARPDSAVHPAFRVIDQATRERSLLRGSLGLIVFNLKERRIIQVQNEWSDLQRHDTGRYQVDGEERTFSYSLPDTWTLVP